MVFTITKNVNISEEDRGCLLKQYALSFIVSLPFFTNGVESLNLTISSHAGHFTTPEQIPWTTVGLILGTIGSALIYSYVIDTWGRRFGIFVVVLLQGVSCIPLLIPPNDIAYIILHVLAGISTAGLFICIPVYIREICDVKYRGTMMSLMVLMTTAGYLMRLALDADNRLYLIAGVVFVQFVTLFMMVESPAYLVKVGKIQAAKTSMGKLKCLPADDTYIVNQITLLKEESERAKPNGVLRWYQIFKNQIWRGEIKIGIMLFTTIMLSGCIIFLDQNKVLIQLKTSTDLENNILVPICLFLGALFCVILVRIFERKYLLTFALSVMVLSMGTLAVFTQADLTVTSLRWLPVAALGVLVFGYGVAWGLPTIVMVEMLNLEIRTKVLGMVYTYSQILRLAHVYTFKYIEDYVGIYTLLYIFACINLFGAVYTISNVPDIKDKSVRQIEGQLKKIPIIK
ncbi:facilitated trehalose transporter Tret1-like [Maniola hyperantus]|uniref:facilitated trehalose transporter Tret1-like n=1 Tax=Aphantopus hyperantus TaxID=2795564 RepID=UPI001568A2DB|nr:glucose transporter GlcP-like [Maniola hyperantus]XP_034826205.1 glucose transporter GlcP-like [Maniola hyperantus]XP_034826206.1 glucose transporter GlcP-like [Maniola hyperantus]